jgi:glutaredoxin 3|tara:strand:+ start:666 stop:893 length:228 start_codon:yes stop_codon:yes gene_type:complete
MNIEIWGKPQCPFCDMAKQLVEHRELRYTYKQLGIDFDRNQMLETFPQARTFPQITIDGVKIGGYDKLKSMMEHV